MNWFGRGKKTTNNSTTSKPVASNDVTSTIVKLRESLAQQDKRIEHLDKKVQQQVNDAKVKMGKKDKRGAMFALKRKKMFEAEIEKIEATKMTIETQIISLESAVQNKYTFDAMKQGTTAMKDVRKDMDVEKVDDIMDDMKEEMDLAAEVSNAISQPIDPYAFDDDELEAELNRMEEEEDLEKELLKEPATTVELPTVPDSKLPATSPIKQNDEEDEETLKALEAELASLSA